MALHRLVLTSVALVSAAPSSALCIYDGQLYAKTTMEQEFRDAEFVVRARVIASDNHWSNAGESWTLYSLKSIATLKGDLPSGATLFTERNSGGFYMDKDDGLPDLDHDYLLFLRRSAGPSKASLRGHFVEVIYSCGQSRRWTDLNGVELIELRRLAARLP